MAELPDAAFNLARARGRRLAATEPHARAARYDRSTGRLVIELTNGGEFSVPARFLQGLETATDYQLAAIEIGSGYGVHWPELDADFTVAGLLAGRFGTARYMMEFRKRQQQAA